MIKYFIQYFQIEIASIAKSNELITVEEKAIGKVKWDVYKTFIKSAGGWWVFSLVIILYIITQVVIVGDDMWLSEWSSEIQKDNPKHKSSFYLYIYLGFAALNIFFVGIRVVALNLGSLRASKV